MSQASVVETDYVMQSQNAVDTHVSETLLLAKPGLSGTWQVSGRSEINFDVRIKMDAEYVMKRSIWYDIKILLLTIPAMISGRGAV